MSSVTGIIASALSDWEDKKVAVGIEGKLERDERLTLYECSFIINKAFEIALNRHRGIGYAWRHKKSGEVYSLHDHLPVSLREGSLVLMVNYVPERLWTGGHAVWTRPLDEFLDKFEPIRKVEVWEPTK